MVAFALAGTALVGGVTAGGVVAVGSGVASATGTFLGPLTVIKEVASTVPSSTPTRPGDGDVNPYGVAVVPVTTGRLSAGDVLISNFNNSQNLQGTGRTIVEISPGGGVTTFARLPELGGGTGLTTALAVLPQGFVVVGNLPTANGDAATATRGALAVLGPNGHLVETIVAPDINGPWDLAAVNFGNRSDLFVTNVLNGTVAAHGRVVDGGTVVRLDLRIGGTEPVVTSNTVIGSGFPEETNPSALVVGPTGVALGGNGTLYVADSLTNSIQGIPSALSRATSDGTGLAVSPTPHTPTNLLNDPLGLTVAPNGDVLAVNGANGYAVEIAPDGSQVASRLLDDNGTPPGGGALFGLAVTPSGHALYFVDDDSNQLNLLTR
jgi:sugar lactone lactonase YvrE